MRKTLSDDVKKQIAADRAAGMAVKSIAEKHGINRSTVSRVAPLALEERAEVLLPTTDMPTLEAAQPDAVVASFLKTIDAGPQVQPQPPIPRQPERSSSELSQRILLNAETFLDLFPNTPSHEALSRKSASELQALLSSMEHTRAVTALSTQVKQVFFVTSRATEVLGSALLRLKLGGMTDALMQQQKELDFLFKEIAIKHADWLGATTEPEVRLAMLFGIAVLQTDATNRMREASAAAATVTEKYADL
jgi:transposase-like protein